MANYRRKSKWKSILCGILVVATLIGACAGIAAIGKKETKTIGARAFSRGDLDEKGEYVKSDKAIYTEVAFACDGLRIEPDFEFEGTYDVYYYDNDDRFVEAITDINGVYDEDYPLYFVRKARVVIHPEIPEGEKDFKIAFYEVLNYAKQLKVIVNKEQIYKYENSVNLFNIDNCELNMTFDSGKEGVDDNFVTVVECEGLMVTEDIAVTGEYKKYDIYVKDLLTNSDVGAVSVVAASSDNKVLARSSYNLGDLNAGEWCRITLEVPQDYDGEMYIKLRCPIKVECLIFGYND